MESHLFLVYCERKSTKDHGGKSVKHYPPRGPPSTCTGAKSQEAPWKPQKDDGMILQTAQKMVPSTISSTRSFKVINK